VDGARPNEVVYAYTSRQQVTMLWCHDHAMAIIRLNIYAGLAGLYLIRDAFEDSLPLPCGDFEVPLILQDRNLTSSGALSYPDRGPTWHRRSLSRDGHRIVLRFELPPPIDGIPGTRSEFPAPYIQHCHMLEHEDNEIMRPWQIISWKPSPSITRSTTSAHRR
jgi:FtsP/CotA-like multicopper oxidase with cupredoxin domain